MADTSTRRGIVYPSPTRIDAADVPLYMKNIVDKVDNDVEYTSGTYAGRPAAGTPGRLYRIDSGTPLNYLYFDNGTDWVQIYPSRLPTIGMTPPASPSYGDIWLVPIVGTDWMWEFIYYPTGTHYWKCVGAADLYMRTVNPTLSVPFTVDVAWHTHSDWMPNYIAPFTGFYTFRGSASFVTPASAEGFGYAGIGVSLGGGAPANEIARTHFGGMVISAVPTFNLAGEDAREVSAGNAMTLAYYTTQTIAPLVTNFIIKPVAISA